MLNKTKRIFAILLAVAMLFSIVGCNKKVEEQSSGGVEYVVEEEIVYEDGTTGTTVGGSSQTVTQESSSSGGIDYSKYKGTTVKFAATIDPKNDEGGPVVDAFEKEYGIDVETVLVENSDYANQISGLIAAGKAPDFVRVSANFPSCISYLQPLECTKLNFNDTIWNQAVLNISTFNGKPYFADTVNSIWAECDVVVYSKSILKKAGANTPEDYDKAGKWTWDAFFEICRKVKNINPTSMKGGGFITRESAIYGMGGGLIQLKNGKFVNGVNSRTQEAMVKFTTAWKEGIIDWATTDGIEAGTVGITTCHIWKLKNTSDWKSGFNTSDLGFYYLPRWDAGSDYGNTGMVRGWGISKGASNPVAAGAFMKYYLDVGNYNLNCFITPAAQEFFFKANGNLNKSSWNPSILYPYDETQPAIAGIDAKTNGYYQAMSGDPAQIGSIMGSVKGAMDKAAKNLNSFVSKQIS
ncbi:MAG: extracellular solute-binding protein [Clostridia bacterium]|nr:extracellular solute-binding protein [Clostridia bacterium]